MLGGQTVYVRYNDIHPVFQNIRVGNDLWKKGLAVCGAADKLLAKAIAKEAGHGLQNRFSIMEGTDFHDYVVLLRRADPRIPLPNLTSGPFREKYFKECSKAGTYQSIINYHRFIDEVLTN